MGMRINAGLSRDDLARRSGVSRETIRKAEAGVVPSVPVQGLLALALKCAPLTLWPIEVQRRPVFTRTTRTRVAA